MTKKTFLVIIVLVMISCNFSVVGKINDDKYNQLSYCSYSDNPFSENIQIKEINVAVFSQVFLMGAGHSKFFKALNGYSWVVRNTLYTVVVDKIYDKDIYRGDLTTDNYDVLIMPGGGGGGGCIRTKWQINRPLVKIWRKWMIDFIKDGGGYYGVCGGTWFLLDYDKPPRTLSEIRTDRSSLGVSCVKLARSDEPYGNIIVSQFTGRWDTVGSSAYMYYSGWDFGPTQLYPGGLWINVSVNKNHSIFYDYLDDTVRISWSVGPAYSVPEKPDREVTVLANFPEYKFSDNEKTRIHYWKYTGGVKGLINGVLESIIKEESFLKFYLPNYFYKASDWERSDKIVETNFSNKPFMTAEVYPNENQARIFLCSGHPEDKVLFGGEIIELEDNDANNLYQGFIGWANYADPDETVEDEDTYIWWIVRRGVAWAAKVPDDDLPPIYGPSQVSDIYPYEQSSNFNITGNAEVAEGIISLDLYYRHSADNETWSDWTLYKTDENSSDGWSWEFNAPVVPAHYQFCSLRNVQFEHEWLNETAPPGPDAVAYVGE